MCLHVCAYVCACLWAPQFEGSVLPLSLPLSPSLSLSLSFPFLQTHTHRCGYGHQGFRAVHCLPKQVCACWVQVRLQCCKSVGLFCRSIGLFCKSTGLFFGSTWLFCGSIGLFCRYLGQCVAFPCICAHVGYKFVYSVADL